MQYIGIIWLAMSKYYIILIPSELFTLDNFNEFLTKF